MKKNFKFYALIWAILLAAFNVVVFLVRPVIPEFVIEYDARFWIVWTFILAAFIGNLACAYFALKTENIKKMFYNLSLITASRSALIAMFIVGSVLMLIPSCPAWIAAVVCVLIFAFNAVSIAKSKWAADTVNEVDEKVNAKTFFIRSFAVDAESLISKAKSEEAKAACKKVYEAARYSDPMSNAALAGVESRITLKFDELSQAVARDDGAAVESASAELLMLLDERSKKCRLMK